MQEPAEPDEISELCAIAEYPDLAPVLIGRKVTVREARIVLQTFKVREYEKTHVRSPVPVFLHMFDADAQTGGKKRIVQEALHRLGSDVQPGFPPATGFAFYQELDPCLNATELGTLGFRIPQEAGPPVIDWTGSTDQELTCSHACSVSCALARLPVSFLRSSLEAIRNAEAFVNAEPLTSDKQRVYATQMAAILMVAARRMTFAAVEDVLILARENHAFVAHFFQTLYEVASSIHAVSGPERQRTIITGVQEHAVKGVPEIPIVWHSCGLDLLARSLHGRKRHELLGLKYPGEILRRAFALGICDPIMRKPYFRESGKGFAVAATGEAIKLPLTEVWEFGRQVLWLSGMVGKGLGLSYHDPIGDPLISSADDPEGDELSFLLGKVGFSSKAPAFLRPNTGEHRIEPDEEITAEHERWKGSLADFLWRWETKWMAAEYPYAYTRASLNNGRMKERGNEAKERGRLLFFDSADLEKVGGQAVRRGEVGQSDDDEGERAVSRFAELECLRPQLEELEPPKPEEVELDPGPVGLLCRPSCGGFEFAERVQIGLDIQKAVDAITPLSSAVDLRQRQRRAIVFLMRYVERCSRREIPRALMTRSEAEAAWKWCDREGDAVLDFLRDHGGYVYARDGQVKPPGAGKGSYRGRHRPTIVRRYSFDPQAVGSVHSGERLCVTI